MLTNCTSPGSHGMVAGLLKLLHLPPRCPRRRPRPLFGASAHFRPRACGNTTSGAVSIMHTMRGTSKLLAKEGAEHDTAERKPQLQGSLYPKSRRASHGPSAAAPWSRGTGRFTAGAPVRFRRAARAGPPCLPSGPVLSVLRICPKDLSWICPKDLS